MKKTGTADLPLHGGHAPRWLFSRMIRLSSAVTEAIVLEYGPREFLRRISDPCWFQAFACVIGFDWHSSGTTTTACGALKLAVKNSDIGIFVAGGKGRASRKTQNELEEAAERFGLGDNRLNELKYASRMTAKVDNACIQDSYQLYHHSFFLSEDGEWAVVQQGMNNRHARRYHWLSEGVKCFIDEPHTGICSDRFEDKVLDMTAKESEEARKISVDMVRDNPTHILPYIREGSQRTLVMPDHHPVLEVDIGRGGFDFLKKAYELQPRNYEELISLAGMGPKRVRALALISEVVYGQSPSWRDPAKYSFAHGGKDGFPYPVDKKTYDSSIEVLEQAVSEAKIGRNEKKEAIRRLREFLV